MKLKPIAAKKKKNKTVTYGVIIGVIAGAILILIKMIVG